MSHAVVFRFASLLALAFLLNGGVAAAATFVVDTTTDADDAAPGDGSCAIAGGGCALRAAIREANALAGADGITVPAGTYVLTIAGQNEGLGATGDLDPSSNLTITGAGSGTTIVDANGIDRVFETFGPVAMSGLTIRNGSVPSNVGGGILHRYGTLTLTDVAVTGNQALRGGGIANQPGPTSAATVTMTNVVVSHNTAATSGGGVLNETLVGVVPLLVSGTVSMTDCVIFENSAADGGGVAAETNLFTPLVTMVRTTVRDNVATSGGGGVYDTGYGFLNRVEPALHAIQSTISGNVATVGGGIHGGAVLEETTLSGNRSDGDGGAMHVPPRFECEIRGSTITANVADADGNGSGDGGGLHRAAPYKCTIGTSILAGNQDTGGEAPECAAADLESDGYNLFGSAAGCLVGGDATGNVAGLDPGLGPLAANGGPTLTHALLPGSPALDAASGCSATDQRGVARPQGPACDIGAVEQAYVATNCGNGSLDGGEACDDGNVRDGDCCDHLCQLESAGSACSDGNPCTNDACDGAGACVHSANAAPCTDASVCTPGAATCAAGSCVTAPPLPCDDGNVCTANTCDDVSGCFNPAQSGPCDDGNACTSPDQCQSGSCHGTPTNDPCDDDSVCTIGDHCDAGACVGSSTLSCTATCERCDPQDGCVFRARDDCQLAAARGARLQIKDRDNPKADALQWNYSTNGGPEFEVFNDPLEVCVFDETGGVSSLAYGVQPASTCSGGPCWFYDGRKYSYRDKTASAGGVTHLELNGINKDRKRITLKARGMTLALPTLPLAQDPRVSVELRRRNGLCWASHFHDAKKNDAATFKATSE